MAVRVLAGVIFGRASVCPFESRLKILHQLSTGIVVHHLGSIRLTHTSLLTSQRQSNAEQPMKDHDRDDTLRPKIQSQFNALIDSARHEHKHLGSRDQFSIAVNQFLAREKYRRGHVAFIRVALQRMDEFGLHKDLETYNKLLNVFPRGRFKPRRMLDAFWPRPLPQMELALDLLTKMEENGVNPSLETYQIVKDVFGRESFPFHKCVRLMFLFDKYENADPYQIKGEIPTDPVELARLSLKRIAGGDGNITEHQVRIKLYGVC